MDPFNKTNTKQRHDANFVHLDISDIDDDSSIEVVFVKAPRHLRRRPASPETLSSDDTPRNMSDAIDLISVSKETIDLMDSSDEDSVELSQSASCPANLGISRLPSHTTGVASRKPVPTSAIHSTPVRIAEKKKHPLRPKLTHHRLSNLIAKTNTYDNNEDDDSFLLTPETPSSKKSGRSQATDSSSKRPASNSHKESGMQPSRVLRSNSSSAGKLTETRRLRPRVSKTPLRMSSLRSHTVKSESSTDKDLSMAEREICFDAPTPSLKSDVASSSKSEEIDSTDDEDSDSVEPTTKKESNASRELFDHRACETNRKRAALDKLRSQRAAKRHRVLGSQATVPTKRTLRLRKTKVVYDETEHAEFDTVMQHDCKPPAKVVKRPAVTNIRDDEVNNADSLSSQEKAGSDKFIAETSNFDDDSGLISETNGDDIDRSPEQLFLRNWEQLQEPVVWKYKCSSLTNNSFGEQGNLVQAGREWSKKSATIRTKLIDNKVMVCGGESRFFASRYRRQKCLDLVQWIPMRGTNQANDNLVASMRPTYCSVYTYRDD